MDEAWQASELERLWELTLTMNACRWKGMRGAIGWDLLRAPANLFLAGPALAVKLADWMARRAGDRRLSDWLLRRHILFETKVASEVEWLIATELLKIPFRLATGAR